MSFEHSGFSLKNHTSTATIVSWNQSRGFGFVRVVGSKDKPVFMHIDRSCACKKHEGMRMHVWIVPEGPKGPFVMDGRCESCFAEISKINQLGAAVERVRKLFEEGHKFDVGGTLPYFFSSKLFTYKSGAFAYKVPSPEITAFVKAAIDAAMTGESDERVKFRAESAAREAFESKRHRSFKDW